MATTLVVAALLAPAAAARIEHDEVVATFRSVALAGKMHALVFLPPGYPGAGTRYPVVYFLHGLPAGPATFKGSKWLAASLQAVGRPAILVEPQGAREDDADPEYLNWGPGRNWQTFVSQELVSYVDAHFRTIRSRNGRAIIGVSAGGYGAMIVGLRDLDRFGVIEAWSGYFHATDPTGRVALARGPDTSVHAQIARLRSDLRQRSTFVGFYVGSGDALFRPENVEFDRELSADQIPHLFEVYSGGHTTGLWQAHAASWLSLAMAHLDPASTNR